MNVYDDILNLFYNSSGIGSWEIKGLPPEYPAWVIKFKDEYGVAIKVPEEIEINESFSSIVLQCRSMVISDNPASFYLVLMTNTESDEFYDKFALLCNNFVFTEDGEERRGLIGNPFKWWQEWKKLIGNVDKLTESYDTIAEMISLEHMIIIGETVNWEGPTGGTVDIRGTNFDCEVKSSINRDSNEITLSSELQLKRGKNPLHLYYCAFENSESGISIDDMVERLSKLGMDRGDLETMLYRKGFVKGRAIRQKKYNLLKFWDFVVDDDFPKVTPDSFKNGKLPKGIKKVTYVVDLLTIDYTEMSAGR